VIFWLYIILQLRRFLKHIQIFIIFKIMILQLLKKLMKHINIKTINGLNRKKD